MFEDAAAIRVIIIVGSDEAASQRQHCLRHTTMVGHHCPLLANGRLYTDDVVSLQRH